MTKMVLYPYCMGIGRPASLRRNARRVTSRAAMTFVVFCAVWAPAANAGTNGQHIELYAPVQQSVRVCGSNQQNRSVCHVWNLTGTASSYQLAGWWWKGSVRIENYSGLNAVGYLDTTSCQVPTRQSSNWTSCNGFSYASLYDNQVNHPGLVRFAIPHAGAQWGIVNIAFFISAAHIAVVGIGDNRGFATNGFPSAGGARVQFLLDYGAGIGVMRLDASCGIAPLGCGGPNPIVRDFPFPWGRSARDAINYYWAEAQGPVSPGSPTALDLEFGASNGAAQPAGAWLLGEIDGEIVLKTEPGGNLILGLRTKAFPSVEAYQVVKGATRTLLRLREAGWSSGSPIDNASDPSSLKQFNFKDYVVCTSRTYCTSGGGQISPPSCSDVSASTTAGQAVSVQLSCSPPAGQPQAFHVVSNLSHGSLSSLDATAGTILYTPAPGYSGSDSFTYRATDPGGVSNTSTVSLTISPAPPAYYVYHVYGTCADGGCGLHERSGPGYSNYPIVGTLYDGDEVDILCQTTGELVTPNHGVASDVWDNLTNGSYVTDVYVDTPGTGGSFSPPIPRC